jgi:hypothetical protein
MDVFQANDSFHFDKLQLSPPQHIAGGSYLTRYSYCQSKQPLYIQTTKTLSKQGIVIAGKKAYIDLVLTTNDGDTEFFEWMTNLEKRSVELLYEKRHIWFTQELDQTDIENSLASPLRAYKTGNYLLRINLEPSRNITTNTSVQPFLCKVFDENKKSVSVEYIKAEQSIISIVEFQGIKFTSRNFQIELLLRQVLVIPDVPLFETCLIRDDASRQVTATIQSNEPIETNNPVKQKNDLGLVVNKCMELPDDCSNSNPEADAYTKTEIDAVENGNEIHDGPLIDETEKYISERPLKHFEYTEVDIDFKNIPDVIDVNEPTFEVQTGPSKTSKPITLKKHKEVLYEMYKIAKQKATEMKTAAMRAYLEAKEIKAKYLLDDLDDLDSKSSDDDSKN